MFSDIRGEKTGRRGVRRGNGRWEGKRRGGGRYTISGICAPGRVAAAQKALMVWIWASRAGAGGRCHAADLLLCHQEDLCGTPSAGSVHRGGRIHHQRDLCIGEGGYTISGICARLVPHPLPMECVWFSGGDFLSPRFCYILLCR